MSSTSGKMETFCDPLFSGSTNRPLIKSRQEGQNQLRGSKNATILRTSYKYGPPDLHPEAPGGPESAFYKRIVLRELPYAMYKHRTVPFKLGRDVQGLIV